MAKPDYPGLVMVPPSDRSILKRRLTKWAFLIISIIAAVFGLGGIAAGAATIAKWLFVIFLIAFVVSLIMHFTRGGRGPTV